MFELLGSSLAYICIGDSVVYQAKVLKTKVTALDNNPMTVIRWEDQDGNYLFKNINYEGYNKIRVFNQTEHQFINLLPSSLQIHYEFTLDTNKTTLKHLIAYLLSPDSTNLTKAQIIKYLLLNQEKLRELDDQALKVKLRTFLEQMDEDKTWLTFLEA